MEKGDNCVKVGKSTVRMKCDGSWQVNFKIGENRWIKCFNSENKSLQRLVLKLRELINNIYKIISSFSFYYILCFHIELKQID
jgi:hypothetical protein